MLRDIHDDHSPSLQAAEVSARSAVSCLIADPDTPRVDSTILRLLLEMTKLPSATKAWRFQVAEAFNDQKFFRMREDVALMWKPLICALMDGDKERAPR
jgi:hypothetical protein